MVLAVIKREKVNGNSMGVEDRQKRESSRIQDKIVLAYN